MTRAKAFFSILAFALVGAFLVACGGSGDSGGGADPQQVIDETFSGSKDINSGNIDLAFEVTATGDQGGSFNAKIAGPFSGQTGQFPKFALTASVSGEGGGQNINFEGGLTSTGDNAFVKYQGADYEVGKDIFDQIKSQYEKAQKTATTQSDGSPFSKLGINPGNWLTNLKNEGTENVGGAETIHISADADVSKAVDDFKKLLEKAPDLGIPGGDQLPKASDLDQVKEAIKEAHFDIYTGESDKILRKAVVTLKITPPESAGGPSEVGLNLSFTISELNEAQTISAPANAKPITDLLGSLGLGGIPGAGSIPGAGGGGDSGGGSGNGGGAAGGGAGGAPAGGPAAEAQQKYLACLRKAKDQAAIADCAKLIQ